MTQSFESPVAPADNLKELPKLGALEIFGRMLHASQERNDMLSGLQRSHEKYGEAVAFNLPAIKMVNLFGPDANRFVLLDQERIFSARKPWMAIMGKIFPNGLLLLDGDEHKLNRKVMHTAFTRPALSGYTELMNTIVDEETELALTPRCPNRTAAQSPRREATRRGTRRRR